MRSRKELLKKRTDLRNELQENVKLGNDKKTNAMLKLNLMIRFAQLPAEIGLLDWILNKPTAKQLKYEEMIKNNKK